MHIRTSKVYTYFSIVFLLFVIPKMFDGKEQLFQSIGIVGVDSWTKALAW
jgi:hypothetical protein